MPTISDIKEMAEQAREAIWEQAENYDREPKVYLHWTAGHYHQQYDSYHINIDGEGNIFVSTNDFSEVLAHTAMRNTGSVGITLDCCAFATTDDLGDEPPTDVQIEVMAQCIAAVCEGLWLTIDKDHVLTHGEAADNEDGLYTHEPYGPRTDCERWDLEFLGTSESPYFNPWADDGTRGGDILRGKANWYAQQMRSSETPVSTQSPTLPDGMISEHFSLNDVTCHCCGKGADIISPRLMELLEQLVANIGGPIKLSCAYRCPAHNAETPGSEPNSQHIYGTAADVQTPNFQHCHTPEQLKWYCEQLPFDGIGLYDWGCHVDVRDGGINAGYRW